MSVKGVQERKTENIHRKGKRISPQRSKRGSLYHRRSPSGWGMGLGYDTILLFKEEERGYKVSLIGFCLFDILSLFHVIDPFS